MGCGVWGVGCGVWGVGCGVWGVGSAVCRLQYAVCSVQFGVWSLESGVWSLGSGVRGVDAGLTVASATSADTIIILNFLFITLTCHAETRNDARSADKEEVARVREAQRLDAQADRWGPPLKVQPRVG